MRPHLEACLADPTAVAEVRLIDVKRRRRDTLPYVGPELLLAASDRHLTSRCTMESLLCRNGAPWV